jgi:hypothetical protein
MALDRRTSYAVEWLLSCDEPAIRAMTRRDVLGQPVGDDVDLIRTGPMDRLALRSAG